MRTLFCIANSNARKFKKNPDLLVKLRKHFPHDRGKLCQTNTLEEADLALREMEKMSPDIVVVCGGDGSLQYVVNKMIPLYRGKALPKIVVIPAGTMNVVFQSTTRNKWRKKLRFDKVFSELVRQGEPLPSVALPILECNGTFGFIFAIGGFANFVAWYRDTREPTPLHAIKLMAKLTLSTLAGGRLADRIFPTFPVTAQKDGLSYLHRAPIKTVSVSAVSHIGLGIHMYPHAQKPDQKLGLFVLWGSTLFLPMHILSFVRNKVSKSRAFSQGAVERLLIQTLEPCVWMLDGEIFPETAKFDVQKKNVLEFA